LFALVNVGATFNVAELLVVVVPLVTTTRKMSPFIDGTTPDMFRLAVVAPLKVTPDELPSRMSEKLPTPFC
jgi:hypothetical protein